MDFHDGELKGDCVLDRYKYLLEYSYNADLTLLLKEDNNADKQVDTDSGKEYRVHRIIMAASSPVFDRMLYGSFPQKEPIILRESCPHLFPLLLEYIYARYISLENSTESDKFSLLEMAHKYMMHDLVEICGASIKTLSLSQELFKTMNTAVLYNVKSLKRNCCKIFIEHTTCSFHEPEFFMLSPEAMCHIVQLEEMYIHSELEVFQALFRWAETSLGIKKYIHQPNETVEDSLQDDSINTTTDLEQSTERITNNKLEIPYGLANIENEIVKIQSIVELDTTYGNIQKTSIYPIPSSDIIYKDSWIGEYLSDLNETHSEYGLKIRKFLDESNCFRYIRFLTMTAREFCTIVLRTRVLTLDEVNYILLNLNTSVLTLKAPEGICTITTPRHKYKRQISLQKRILCVATVSFHFLTPHWFEVVSFLQFKEIFYCASDKAICLETVSIPSKEKKKHIISNVYDEEISIEFEFVNADGTKINTFAQCNFKGKRKYQEDKAFPLVYNMNSGGSVLKKGMYFSVGVSIAKAAMYLGGFEYSQRCIDNDFIQVSENKAKGIIKGFSFSFRL